MVSKGPLAVSDMWRGLGVDHAKAFQAYVDDVVAKLLACEEERTDTSDAAYQDDMRRG